MGEFEKSLTVVFSAGNVEEGWQGIRPGKAAKNVIAVGGIMYQEGDNIIHEYSARGPTKDGRLKPEVVAYWSYALSDAYSIFSSSTSHLYFTLISGTSAACPQVAGAAALLYEAWYDKISINRPLASTIKAILCHTANDELYQSTDPLYNNTKGPDYKYGYGLIQIDKALELIMSTTSENRMIIEGTMKTDDVEWVKVYVPEGQTKLQVTLCWDDYEGQNTNSGKDLLNDVDLLVIGPDDNYYYPWKLNKDNPGDPATRV